MLKRMDLATDSLVFIFYFFSPTREVLLGASARGPGDGFIFRRPINGSQLCPGRYVLHLIYFYFILFLFFRRNCQMDPAGSWPACASFFFCFFLFLFFRRTIKWILLCPSRYVSSRYVSSRYVSNCDRVAQFWWLRLKKKKHTQECTRLIAAQFWRL